MDEESVAALHAAQRFALEVALEDDAPAASHDEVSKKKAPGAQTPQTRKATR
jgi:hypothetical protein